MVGVVPSSVSSESVPAFLWVTGVCGDHQMMLHAVVHDRHHQRANRTPKDVGPGACGARIMQGTDLLLHPGVVGSVAWLDVLYVHISVMQDLISAQSMIVGNSILYLKLGQYPTLYTTQQ